MQQKYTQLQQQNQQLQSQLSQSSQQHHQLNQQHQTQTHYLQQLEQKLSLRDQVIVQMNAQITNLYQEKVISFLYPTQGEWE